eukprot:7385341-Prymnesium_polylepis.1
MLGGTQTLADPKPCALSRPLRWADPTPAPQPAHPPPSSHPWSRFLADGRWPPPAPVPTVGAGGWCDSPTAMARS